MAFVQKKKGRKMSFQQSYLVEYDFWREISISLDKIIFLFMFE